MTQMQILIADDWNDYTLIDSGDGMKLERFADFTVVRPDPRILWQPKLPQSAWDLADAAYVRSSKTEGHWQTTRPPKTPWIIQYRHMKFILHPTSFKHVGIFPEQAVNWHWIEEKIQKHPLTVLNLFAYTGAATITAGLAGAHVTHVDSQGGVISWAKENALANAVPDTRIRWIEDDAYKFVTREQKRGVKYDAIILDPPRFGRGTKGEVWKLSDDLPKLINACMSLLSEHAQFLLVNCYTADMSAIALGQLLTDLIKNREGTVTYGELALKEQGANRLLPSGIFARWQA